MIYVIHETIVQLVLSPCELSDYLLISFKVMLMLIFYYNNHFSAK